jgi:single-strand DNA-binding protein
MSYVNRVTLIGNVVRDPEIKMTASGKSVANFTVATNEFWTDAQGEKQSELQRGNKVNSKCNYKT